jgi:hypothetical protein
MLLIEQHVQCALAPYSNWFCLRQQQQQAQETWEVPLFLVWLISVALQIGSLELCSLR